MKEIKQILSDRYWSLFYEYKWFYIIPWISKFWKKLNYKIYNHDYRMIYQWKFFNLSSAEAFIDRNQKLLSLISNLKYKTPEYFTWWYDYYGESIN